MNNEREKAEKIEATVSEYGEDSQQFKDAMDELEVSDANPFWQRLLAPETAYGVDLTKEMAPVLEKALATGMSSQAATTGMHNFRPAAPG